MLKALGNVLKGVGGSISTQLFDQFKQVWTCPDMAENVLCIPGCQLQRDGNYAKGKGTHDKYISSGSVFNVPLNTAALVIENGRVRDIVVADTNELAGQYTIDLASAPSLFASNDGFWNGLKATFGEFLKRQSFGGTSASVAQIVYVNLRTIPKFGIGGSINFRDPVSQQVLKLGINGFADIRVADPMTFFAAVVSDPDRTYTSADGKTILDNLRTLCRSNLSKACLELRKRLQRENPQSRWDEFEMMGSDLAAEFNTLEGVAGAFKQYGLAFRCGSDCVTSLNIEADPASRERIEKWDERMTIGGGNAAAGYAMQAQGEAMLAAANNSAGAAVGMMGMGMMGNMGNAFAGIMQQQQAGMAQPQMQNGYGQPQMQNGYGQAQMQNGYGQPQMQGQQMPMQGQQPQMQGQQPQMQAQPPVQPAPVPQEPVQQSSMQAQPVAQPETFAPNDTEITPPAGAIPVEAAGAWTCACGYAGNTMGFCVQCGSKKPEPQPAPTDNGPWTCTNCGYSQNQMGFCANCGSKKPEAPAKPKVLKCDKCGWTPNDPTQQFKFCPQCGDVFNDQDWV